MRNRVKVNDSFTIFPNSRIELLSPPNRDDVLTFSWCYSTLDELGNFKQQLRDQLNWSLLSKASTLSIFTNLGLEPRPALRNAALAERGAHLSIILLIGVKKSRVV